MRCAALSRFPAKFLVQTKEITVVVSPARLQNVGTRSRKFAYRSLSETATSHRPPRRQGIGEGGQLKGRSGRSPSAHLCSLLLLVGAAPSFLSRAPVTTEPCAPAHDAFCARISAQVRAAVHFASQPESTSSIFITCFVSLPVASVAQPALGLRVAHSRIRRVQFSPVCSSSTVTARSAVGAIVTSLYPAQFAWFTMATGDTAPPVAPSSPPPPLDNSPSNLSSPLSEVDDKDGDTDEVDLDMRDDGEVHETPKHNGATGDQGLDAASESDESKLSEVDVNDSEAETERLYDTPPKSGKARNIVNTAGGDAGHRRFTDRRDRVFERSPSKLHQQLQVGMDTEDGTSARNSASVGEDEDDDDVSMASSQPDLESVEKSQPRSPTLAKKSQAVSPDEAVASRPSRHNTAESRKRKRSSLAEQSESEQPPKKRPGSNDEATRESSGDDTPMVDDEGVSTNPQSGNHTAEEDENDELTTTTEAKEELPDQAEEDVVAPTRSKKGKRNSAKKRKSKSPEEAGAQDGAPDEPPEDADAQSPELPTAQVEENHAEEVDEEAEAAHRNEEERMK